MHFLISISTAWTFFHYLVLFSIGYSLIIYIPFVSSVMHLLIKYFDDNQVAETRDYPFVDISPFSLLFLMSAYLALTTRLIPAWMKDRPAFSLRRPMFIYNILMVICNAVFFPYAVYKINFGRRLMHFNYPPVVYSSNSLLEINMLYIYWLTKFADLADTFFFCWRKKSSHISVLHLYHHTSVREFSNNH
jgi:hypothetical protein